MENKQNKKIYSSLDVERAIVGGWSIWSYIAYLYPSRKLAYFVGNKTNLSPNQLTVIGFLFSIPAAFFFLRGDWESLIIGSILFIVSFLFDCIDGVIARLKGMTSTFGDYLDGILDAARMFILVFGLTYGQYLITKDASYLTFGIFYVFIYVMQWISKYLIYMYKLKENIVTTKLPPDHPLVKKLSFFYKIKNFFEKKKVSIFPGFMEADALVFIIAPILRQIKLGVVLAGIIVILDTIIFAYIFFKLKLKK